MADCAEHNVFLVKQGRYPRFHGIVSDDQPPDIVRPFRGDLPHGVAGFGEALDLAGQRRQRPGDPSQDKGDSADQDGINQQGLANQRCDKNALTKGDEDTRNVPISARQMESGKHQVFGLLATALAEHAAPLLEALMRKAVGRDFSAQDDHFGNIDVLIGKNQPQFGFCAPITIFAGQ